MANPLDQVTQNQSDEAFPQGLRRVVIRTDDGSLEPAPDSTIGSNQLTRLVSPEAVQPQWTVEDLTKGLAALKEYIANGEFSPGTRIGSRLFGSGGQPYNQAGDGTERFQTWPERMIRSGASLAGDTLSGELGYTASLRRNDVTDLPPPNGMMVQAEPGDPIIERSLDMAGLAGGGSLLTGPRGGVTLGSGPVRPGMRDSYKIPGYKIEPSTKPAYDVVGPNGDVLATGYPQREANWLAQQNDGARLRPSSTPAVKVTSPRGEVLFDPIGRDFAHDYVNIDPAKVSYVRGKGASSNLWFPKHQNTGTMPHLPSYEVRQASGTKKWEVVRREDDTVVSQHDNKALAEKSIDSNVYPDLERAAPRLMSDTQKPGAAIAAVASSGPAPVFYSALEHAATNAAQDVMSPSQWLGYLKNQPGVKAEELAWTGIGDWLGTQKGKVKKEDVQRYLDGHKVEIKDVTKRSDDGEPHLRQAAIEHVAEDYPDVVPGSAEHQQLISDYLPWAREALEAEGAQYSSTKYSSYQLPGGENYREHLLMMPARGVTPEAFVAAQAAERAAGNAYDRIHTKLTDKYGPGGNFNANWLGKATSEEMAQFKEVQQAAIKASDDLIAAKRGKDDRPAYTSSHWDEPNVLAHVRTKDRVMNDPRYEELIRKIPIEEGQPSLTAAERTEMNALKPKKFLHIEEIQSDWHQQGRKQGYRPEQEKQMAELTAKRDSMLREARDLSTNDARHKEIYAELPRIQAQINDIESAGVGVPDAPFKTTWPELALKRMIRHAAEGGYDRISWTPGEAQAARYDLSKTIKKLEWDPETHELFARDHGNKLVIGEPGKGQIVPPEKLADTIGKEAAEKLIKGENKVKGETVGRDARKWERHVLEDQELKFGGEGMREFYDKILPRMVEKIGKAHGVKVKQIKIPGNTNVRGGEAMNVPPKEIYETLTEYDPKLKEQFPTIADFVDYFNDLTSEHRADLIASARAKGTQVVHYFDIPQSLKEHAIGKGFPLYMSGIPFPLTPVDHDPFKKKDK